MGRLGMPTVLTLGQLGAAGAAFLVNLLAASVMAPAERGNLALLLQLTYLGAVFVVLGVERPLVARIEADYRTSLQTYWRLITPGLWILVLPLIAAAVAFALLEVSWGIALMAMAMYLLFNALGKGVRVAAIASGTLRAFVTYTIATQAAIVLLALILTWINIEDPVVWYGAYVLSGAIAGAAFLAARGKQEAPVARDEINKVRREGLRLLPASIGNTALLRSDRLILPIFAGTAQLGIYIVVATVMEIATWPVSQWVDASLRRWAVSDVASSDARRRVRTLYGLSALFAAGLSAVLGASRTSPSRSCFLPSTRRPSI
ncbi:lipopolysaccharide biosynthesis protein [Microbacterium sp. JZ31]|uniref:lipopolysaccharide biosynthesis protein n=1 Tax=Microbacterium sp. JZ31 TaxID=1906274 RepID=UPI001931A429|nr:oligosaccharide flippase family protein [Microbacterium sp. JZ31]